MKIPASPRNDRISVWRLKPLGFTIIELLVAVTLITLALLAIIGLNITSLQQSIFSTNQTKATKYGSEALEAVRAIRDAEQPGTITNYPSGTVTQWSQLAATPIASAQTYQLVKSGNIWRLNYVSGPASFDIPGDTSFKRIIRIVDDSDVSIKKITVEIQWGAGASTSSFFYSKVGPRKGGLQNTAGPSITPSQYINFAQDPPTAPVVVSPSTNATVNVLTNLRPTSATVFFRYLSDPVTSSTFYVAPPCVVVSPTVWRCTYTFTISNNAPGDSYFFSVQVTGNNAETVTSQQSSFSVN